MSDKITVLPATAGTKAAEAHEASKEHSALVGILFPNQGI